MTRALLLLVSALALAGCGERPQTATGSSSDVAPHEGTGLPYVATGWKPGDRASWEAQMKARTQGQNDYAKVN